MSNLQQTHQHSAQNKADVKAKKSTPQAEPGAVDISQFLEAPQTLRPENILAAQQQVGNNVVQRSLEGNTIQRVGEEFENLGGGSANQVYRVTRPNGGETGYFKPNTAHDPQMGARSVMSSDIDQSLGLNVLAKETYKRYTGAQLGTPEAKEGTESSHVEGRPLLEYKFDQEINKETHDAYAEMSPAMVKQKTVEGEQKYYKQTGTDFMRHNFANPQTQKDMANIHLQDAITGQNDRHGGNIRIDPNTGQARGYDSDLMSPLQNIGEDSLSAIPNLRKPKGRFAKLKANFSKKARRQAQVQALKKIDTPTDKYLGLPSHIDQASAQKLAGTKSSAFIEDLQARNPENIARMSPEQIEELRNRYSSVRRYAKVGLAAQHPELIADEKKRAKWSSPKYQQTVREGAGMLPTIVNQWGAESYNQQMAQNNPNLRPGEIGKREFSYLQRGVKNYNDAVGGADGNTAENAAAGPLPTQIAHPIPALPPVPGRNRANRHGINLGQRNPVQNRIRHMGMRLSDEDLHDLIPGRAQDQPVHQPDVNPVPQRRNTIFENPEELLMQSDGKRRDNLTNANGELNSELNNAIQKKRGGGSALPGDVQKIAKQALGRDFKDVRIHTDDEAHKLSRSINARAFTIGKDIFFKQGVFAPGTKAGRETIIHELTHVVQQSGNKASGRLKLGAPDTAHEKEADRMGKKHASTVSAAGAGAIQRAAEEDELMMQAEEDELMMQAEEDELMAQPEEEEMMAQPDTGGVIQRAGPDDDEPKIPKAPPPPLPKRPAPKQTGFAAELSAKAKSMSSPKQRRNLDKLENQRSAKVGARVSQQYNEDQAAKPKSFGSKVKGLAGKAGKWGLGKLKDFGKKQVNEYSQHFLHTDIFKDKEKDADGDGAKGQAKSGGSGGMGAIMEEYAKVLQENKELKAKLAEKEA